MPQQRVEEIRALPHWRVVIRPSAYEAEHIPTLKAVYDVIAQATVRFRGWPFPYLNPREEERERGNNWAAGWCAALGHFEYWRMYQSSQFVHLSSVREATQLDWRPHLEKNARHHLIGRNIDLSSVVGFISIQNFIYRVTEIFEFATRLAEEGGHLWADVSISIELENVKGFVLTIGWERSLDGWYECTTGGLSREWMVPTADLVSDSDSHAREAILWFFERFGWLEPPRGVIAQDQKRLRNKLL